MPFFLCKQVLSEDSTQLKALMGGVVPVAFFLDNAPRTHDRHIHKLLLR